MAIKFLVEPVVLNSPSTPGVDYQKQYTVGTADGGLVLTATSGSAVLAARSWTEDAAQRWWFNPQQAGGFAIANVGVQATGDGHYEVTLTVANDSMDDWAEVQAQLLWNVPSNQRWTLEDAGNGWYAIRAVHSGKLLSYTGGKLVQLADLQGEGHVTVYADGDYAGASKDLGVGRWTMANLGIPNDMLSSLKVPPGLMVTLFADDNFLGASKVVMADTPHMSALSFNDTVSSLIVQPVNAAPPGPSPAYVTVYSDYDYGGRSQQLSVGSWNGAALSTVGVGAVSSIKVPQGFKVTLYSGDGFTSLASTYTADTAQIVDFNDLTQSIVVEPVDSMIIQRWQIGLVRDIGVIQKPKATLFQDADYGGSSQQLGLGAWNTGDLTLGNDKVSSLRVPAGLKVTLFSDANFSGASKSFTSDTSHVGDDFNDKTSSVIVETAITLFADRDYKGLRQVLGAGAYDSAALGVLNLMVSSIRVPAGMVVTLYDGPKFTGNKLTLIEDSTYVGDAWNDKTTSVMVANLGLVIPGNAIRYGDKIQLATTGSRFARFAAIPHNILTIVRSGPGKYGSLVAYGDIVSLSAPTGGVTLCQDANYGGSSQQLGVGRWTLDDIYKNDSISSIKVPSGFKVTLYKDNNFQGDSKSFTSDTSYVGDSWNDEATSVVVEWTGSTENYLVVASDGTVSLAQPNTVTMDTDKQFQIIRSGPSSQGDLVAHGDTITLRSLSQNRYLTLDSDGLHLVVKAFHLLANEKFVLKSEGAVSRASHASSTTACGVDMGGTCDAAVCGAAACGAAACLADACGADACGAAACLAAATLAGACGAAAGALVLCGADVCGAAVCATAVCGAAAAGVAACTADACGAAVCGAAACAGAVDVVSAHLYNACAGEADVVDACPADACVAQACVVNLCPANACVADACVLDVVPIVPGI